MVYLIVSAKKGSIPWNKGKTKTNSEGVKKISDTMKLKHIDNFAKWRTNARLSGMIPDSNKALKKSTEFATLLGLILGDGNISRYPRTECLRITLGTDKPLLAIYSVELVKKVLGKAPSMVKRSNSNCYNVTICQKSLGERLGVPTGARGKLEIYFPNWVWNKKSYLISILKGLFEAEASYCVHEKTYTYNFEFSNRNISLLNEVEKGLKTLGYNPERRTNVVRLRKKAEAIGFKDLINFRAYPDI